MDDIHAVLSLNPHHFLLQIDCCAVSHRSVGISYAKLIRRHDACAWGIKAECNLVCNVGFELASLLLVPNLNVHAVCLGFLFENFKTLHLVFCGNHDRTALMMRNVKLFCVLPHEFVAFNVEQRLLSVRFAVVTCVDDAAVGSCREGRNVVFLFKKKDVKVVSCKPVKHRRADYAATDDNAIVFHFISCFVFGLMPYKRNSG